MSSPLASKNFLQRTLSGIVLVAVIVGGILASPYTMAALMILICIGGMTEFYRLASSTGTKPQKIYSTVLGAATVVALFCASRGFMPYSYTLILFPLIFVIFIAELYHKSETPFVNIGWSILGIIYIALPMALISAIGSQAIILGIIIIVWSNDVGAYLFGIMLGKHKLFERISPKKSWEGFFGGVLCAIGAGAAIAGVTETSALIWMGAGAIIAITAVFGDLVESMLKRSLNIKDSGSIIPGHGGFLDRFDALIVAIPFVFVYFTIFTP